MCRLFLSWFDVCRSTFDEDMREKRSFTFSLPVALTLTFRPQICSPSFFTRVQRYVSTKLKVSTAFRFLRKSEAQYRWTDRQTGIFVSSFCQASLPRCASIQSQLVWVSGICCCQLDCLELTE